MPDVRRYLSVFWGVLLILIKLFDYLSDGRAPLVEDLGDVSVFKISCWFSHLVTENQGKSAQK